MIAMILAAGRGERMRPLTDSQPKALLEVAGRSLIERQLDALRRAGVDNVVVNLGWHGSAISERIGSGASYGLTVAYSDEGEKVLETGGGIQRALPLLGSEPFIVVNADVFTDLEFPQTLADDALGHLVLVPTPAHKDRGDFDLVEGRITVGDEPAYTFGGIAIYRPEFFAACEPGRFPLAPMLYRAAEAGNLTGELYEGAWQDIGTPDRLEKLNQAMS